MGEPKITHNVMVDAFRFAAVRQDLSLDDKKEIEKRERERERKQIYGGSITSVGNRQLLPIGSRRPEVRFVLMFSIRIIYRQQTGEISPAPRLAID